jgi:predicted Zn-dependent protease
MRSDHTRALRLARRYTWLFEGDPNSWDALAKVLMELEDFEEAEQALRRGLRAAPSPLLKHRLAELLTGLSRSEEARAVVDELMTEAPGSPWPYQDMAYLALYDEGPEVAKDYALQALARASPRYSWTEYEVAKILLFIPGERDRAIKLLQAFSEKRPEEALPHVLLAAILEKSDPDAIKRHAEIAESLYGTDSARKVQEDIQTFRSLYAGAE